MASMKSLALFKNIGVKTDRHVALEINYMKANWWLEQGFLSLLRRALLDSVKKN